jgi:hypothetical protein
MILKADVYLKAQRDAALTDTEVANRGGFNAKLITALRYRGDKRIKPSTSFKVVRGLGLTYDDAEDLGLFRPEPPEIR